MRDLTAAVGGSAPGIPSIGTATAGNASATVAFTPPAYTGKGGAVTYRALSSPGSISATGSSSPINVTGLTNGVTYSFTVRTETSYGINSAYSSASNVVTPVAPPPPPPPPAPPPPPPPAPPPPPPPAPPPPPPPAPPPPPPPPACNWTTSSSNEFCYCGGGGRRFPYYKTCTNYSCSPAGCTGCPAQSCNACGSIVGPECQGACGVNCV